MLRAYKQFHLPELPSDLQQDLIDLERGGLTTPVLHGGSIRDGLTGFKPIKDRDIRCAGVKSPIIDRKIKSIVAATIGLKSEINISPDPKSPMSRYFYDEIGANIHEAIVSAGALRLKAAFTDATPEKPELDLWFTATSLGKSKDKIRQKLLDIADVTMSCATMDTTGTMIAHKRFPEDAKNKVFRPKRMDEYSGKRLQEYFERLSEGIAGLEFTHSRFSLMCEWAESSFPGISSELSKVRLKARDTYHKTLADRKAAPKQNTARQPINLNVFLSPKSRRLEL